MSDLLPKIAALAGELSTLSEQLAKLAAAHQAQRAEVHAAVSQRLTIERYATRLLGWEEGFDALSDRELMIKAIVGADNRDPSTFDGKSDDWVLGTFDAIRKMHPATPRRRAFSHARQFERLNN